MSGNQINVEFFYRLLYDCLRGTCYGSADYTQFVAWLSYIWLWIILVGYAIAIGSLIMLIYTLVRLFELRKREEEFYSTLLVPAGSERGPHPRWVHIQSLIESMNPSDWRAAIIEADVMLDDALTKEGYVGEGLGEKLKAVDATRYASVQDAWEAHKVRNQIAHEGSAFGLSESLAKRTIARYEAIFRELAII
jgi:hypothetical protein